MQYLINGATYMHTGEWEKAEEQFIAGMQHDCEESLFIITVICE